MERVIAHPEAAGELRESIRYYESKSCGLGRRLFDEVNEHVRRVLLDPTRFAERLHGVRRVNLRRFPYHLNYLILENTIAIVAVSHNKRAPGYWENRLPPAGAFPDWNPL